MITYFMSGKIYQDSPGGKILTGYFSTVASSAEGDSATFEGLLDSVVREYNVDSSQVHVEQFYRI